MAAIIIVEDGTGKSDANSYVSLAEANAFFDTVPQANTWGAQTDDVKTRHCIAATRMIDACFAFLGYQSTGSQALMWPRVLAENKNQYQGAFYRNPQTNYLSQYFDSAKVPQIVKNATCELIRFNLAADRTSDPQGIGLKSFKIFEGVEVEFDLKNARPVIPDYVATMLLDVGNVRGTGSGNVRLGRC